MRETVSFLFLMGELARAPGKWPDKKRNKGRSEGGKEEFRPFGSRLQEFPGVSPR